MEKKINYVISKKDKRNFDKFGKKARNRLLFGEDKIPKGKPCEFIIEPIESEITKQDLIDLTRSVFCRKSN